MAPRRRDNTSTLHPSVEGSSDHVRPLSNGDELNGDHESKNIGHATDDPQSEEMEAPAPQSYALVLGGRMLVPQTYDPDTYDPDGRMPWTPEPEPYSSQTYAAWGRKHFGEEWYKLRKTMLEERNIYRQDDPVYRERQRALRVMEHKVEGRPFEPGFRAAGMLDAGWKRLWARLSKDLGIGISSNPASPTPSKDNDGSATDLSGYNTYAPTPEPREPTRPLPDDPWERLELNRSRFHWGEERYQFERIILKEKLIDSARAKHEDQDGDRQREKELEDIRKIQYLPGTLMQSAEYDRRMGQFNLRVNAWTQGQIYPDDRAVNAAAQRRSDELKRQLNMPPRSQEEMNSKFRLWDISGISREEQDRLGRMHGFSERPPDPYLFRDPMEKRPRPRNDEEMDQLFRLWTWKLSRAEQDELARMYGFGPRQASTDRHAEGGMVSQVSSSPLRPAKDTSARGIATRNNTPQSPSHRAARSRRSAPTSTEAPPSNRRRRRPSKPDAFEEPVDKTQIVPEGHRRQRRIYQKERASRRLAGQLPEFGLLSGRGAGRSRKSVRGLRTLIV